MTDFVNTHLAQAHANLEDHSHMIDSYFDNGVMEDVLMPIERADVEYEQAQARIAALLAACEAALERMYPAFYEQPVERIDELIEVLTTAIAAAKEPTP